MKVSAMMQLASAAAALGVTPPNSPAPVPPPASVSAPAVKLSAQTQDALRAANPGELVPIPDFNPENLPVFPAAIAPKAGPPLLLSDMPEYFKAGDGTAFQEDVSPGIYRLYVYNVPQPSDEAKTVTAVVENLTNHKIHLTVLREGFPAPSLRYFGVAKEAMKMFFDSPSSGTWTIPPHGWAPMDRRMDHLPESGNALVHGIFEFQVDGQARVSVLQKNPDDDSSEALKALPRLPRIHSGAGRGFFPTADFDVTSAAPIDMAAGPSQLILADGIKDPWLRGRDDISGQNVVIDSGSYGSFYHISLRYHSSAGQGVALLLTSKYGPPKGAGCSATGGVVMVGNQAVMLPAHQDAFNWGAPAVHQAALIAKYPAPDGTIDLTYSPPGSSCIPTPLLFLPYQITPPAGP